MRFTTIAGNFSMSGGGLRVGSLARLSLQNTLLAKNTGADCELDFDSLTSFTTLGNNLATNTNCPLNGPGDKIVADAKLGPLANNGGPTMTHLPQAGSPAIDAAVMLSGITTDQRGITRPQGQQPDIGAVEVP